MKIYFVLEVIPKYKEYTPLGAYTLLENAKNAVLTHVAEEYSKWEMEHFEFYKVDNHYYYDTEETDFLEACTYAIYETELV